MLIEFSDRVAELSRSWLSGWRENWTYANQLMLLNAATQETQHSFEVESLKEEKMVEGLSNSVRTCLSVDSNFRGEITLAYTKTLVLMRDGKGGGSRLR